MAKGQPDFGALAPTETISGISDIGELAARLGAISRYDRLGNILRVEDFEEGIGAWEAETSGSGAAVEWACDRHVTGGFACKMTAGSDGGRYAGIKQLVPVPFSVVYGVEANWTVHEDMDYALIRVDIYTGTYKISFAIKADTVLMYNYYLNALGGWTQLMPQVIPYFNDRHFNNFKFTFDIATQKYSRLLVAPVIFDIKGKSGLIVPNAGYPRMEIYGRIYSLPTKNAYCYIDSMILTMNDI